MRQSNKKKEPKYKQRELMDNYVDESGEEIINAKSTKNLLSLIKVETKPKTKNQEKLIELINENQITICTGAPGSGKTFIACAEALKLLKANIGYDKIILVKPIVEAANENIGYLKGSAEEKVEHYQESYLYIFNKLIGPALTKKLFDAKIIEVVILSYVRGITFTNSVLILDESQNISTLAMKTMLTRIGSTMKYIVLGDLFQSDKYNNGNQSGLYDAKNRLVGIKDIAMMEFSIDDIVRNDLIKEILKRYVDEPQEKEIIVKKKEILND